ncbi:MAG: choice-of-anchor B family protein [Bacteroidota bacterium]
MRFAALCLVLLAAAPVFAQPFPCANGTANDATGVTFACDGVDLLARIPPQDLGAPAFASCPSRACLNDLWGWTDPETGREIALVAVSNGTAFVDVTTPTAPSILGRLPTATGPSTWRDIKVHADHAYIVSEAEGHGLQIFDLRRLRGLAADPARLFTSDARIGEATAHNVAVDPESGRLYTTGGPVPGGIDVYDLADPVAPVLLGSLGSGGIGYTHDAQCVTYDGPDADYIGRQICFAFNAFRLLIVDVTDAPVFSILSIAFYPEIGYVHQGWLTEDGQYLLVNDETDEIQRDEPTRTLVMDVADLDNPEFAFAHDHGTAGVDHNLYVREQYAYQANYTDGLRIVDLSRIGEGTLRLAGSFDTFPEAPDGAPDAYDGAWTAYPFFESGTLVVTDQAYGLFVLRATSLATDAAPPPAPSDLRLGTPVPNPAAGRVTIPVEGLLPGQRIDVALFDVRGREVVSRVRLVGNVAEVETAGLAPGVYRLRASTGARTASTAVVVAR